MLCIYACRPLQKIAPSYLKVYQAPVIFRCDKLNRMNDSFSFNEFGTLTSWKTSPALFPFTKTADSFRGGAFWCIPNQGPTYDIFEMQNGEYRKTVTEHSSSEKKLSGKWGELSANISWKEENGVLTTTASIVSLRDKTHIRPGFHPYFAVDGNFAIRIGSKSFTNETLPHNTKVTVIVHGQGKAILEQESSTVEISFSVRQAGPIISPLYKEGMTFSFCIWSDDITKYVCIEPVIGKDITKEELFDGSPAPITMKKGEEIEIISTISFSSR